MSGVNTASPFAKWVEGHRFFGRPKLVKNQQLTCQDAAKLADYSIRVSTCRTKAANSCATPDIGITWSSDACVCSTLWGYASKFSTCIADTPYSNCYNAAVQNSAYSSWSTGHCLKQINTPTSAPSSSIRVSPTPSPTPNPAPSPTPSPARSTVPNPPPNSPSPVSQSSQLGGNTGPVDTPKPTTPDAPRTPDPPKSTPNAPSPAPEVSLVTIVVASRTTDGSISASITPSASRVPLARWNGNGALLNGYCASPEYTIIDGPTAYWAPVLGCMRAKGDCCPFEIASPTAGLAVRQVASDALGFGSGSNTGGFPNAVSPAQAALTRCPSDYHSVGDGCCPINYYPWTTTFGGQTPCYSAVQAAVTPPPVPENIPANSAKATSAVVNVVYAMQYPLKVSNSPTQPGLSTIAKGGIGAGAGIAVLILGFLVFLLFKKHKAHKRDKAAFEEMSGVGSTRQSMATGSVAGGVKAWQSKVAASEVSSGLEPVQEPTFMQNTVPHQAQYPADWRPTQRTASPPVPAPSPAYFQRASIPSPTILEGYSEAGSSSGYRNGQASRSELHGDEYGVQRQELGGGSSRQPIYQNAYHGGQGGYIPANEGWQHQGVAQEVRYYEVPARGTTPRIG